MSVRNLGYLFRPSSVAVIGASNRPRSVGNVAMRNLLMAGFGGAVMPVNLRHDVIGGVVAYPDVASLPRTPDLAVVATPAATVPGVVGELARRGTRVAVVLTAGLDAELERAMLAAAHTSGLRILGPNCIGVQVPEIGLDASFAHTRAEPGRVAFVSQSGALCTTVLDWASAHHAGFSCFVSLGNMADIDFGDVLDYLAGDPGTAAILLYVEAVRDARKFLSAARAASRNKPVLAIKSGRAEQGARAAASHTGALAGSDAVYDTALRRAGILRVFEIEELFEAVETLSRARTLRGDRLAIVTNGGGPGVLAVDALIAGGGRLADLSDETVAALDRVLPAMWSRANPVDILGDADGRRYKAALEIVLADAGNDAVLAMHTPTAVASSEEAASAVLEAAGASHRQVLTSWFGVAAVAKAREMLTGGGIATYETPSSAVRAFLHMIRFRRNQELLMETPPSPPPELIVDSLRARALVDAVLAEGRSMMSEAEAKELLASYGVPVVPTRIVADAGTAERVAEQVGFPVTLKVLSDEITHKSDVGGVALDLENADAVRTAADAMIARIARLRPGVAIAGFTVQSMVRRPGAYELIVGVTSDVVFGPVILFGQGGTGVEIVADRALALPPLNERLAQDLVSRTRVARLLQGYRSVPAADLAAIYRTILQISQLVVDLPEVVELDVNPLLAGPDGVLALDARVRLATTKRAPLAIRPYPRELEEHAVLPSGRSVFLRPIRPEDEPAHVLFLRRCTPEDIRFRFFNMVREMPHSQMARYTQIDYDREMAFVATLPGDDGVEETLGVARAISNPDNTRAEFAIIVRSDSKGQGIGYALLDKLIRYCRARGTGELVGQVLRENRGMRDLAASFGFEAKASDEPSVVEVRLPLAG